MGQLISSLSFLFSEVGDTLQGEFTHSPVMLLYSTTQKITQFCTPRLCLYRKQPVLHESNIEHTDRNKAW